MLPYQTPGISNQTLVYWEMWKCSRHGRTFWSKVQIFTTPLRKSGSVRDLFYLETFWRTKFLQSGIVFMVVQAFHMTFSSVSWMDKMLTLKIITLWGLLLQKCHFRQSCAYFSSFQQYWSVLQMELMPMPSNFGISIDFPKICQPRWK